MMYRITFIAAIMLLAGACAQVISEDIENQPATKLELSVAVGRFSGLETKAVHGTSFTRDQTIGISLCQHEHQDVLLPYSPMLGNIRAKKTDSGWSFDFNADGVSFQNLYVTRSHDSNSADLYAYSPFFKDINNIREIPLSIKNQVASGGYDLMWAVQNGTVENKDIKNTYQKENGHNRTVNLEFHHAFALLRLGFKLHHDGSRLRIQKVKLSHAAEGSAVTPIVDSVLFDAVTGILTDAHEGPALILDTKGMMSTPDVGSDYFYITSSTEYSYLDIVVYPSELKENYRLTFIVDGIEFGHYDITPESVQHSGGGKGFQSGFCYTFNFTLDNYARLDKLTIDDDWTLNQNLKDEML